MSQKVRVIDIPANNAAPVVIRCTIVATKMWIQEDGSVNAGVQQGLIYNALTPNSADAANAWTAGPDVTIPPGLSLEPLKFEGYPGDHPANAVPIGNGGSYPYPCAPGGPVTHGTPIVALRSGTATATRVNVTEWSA